MVVSVLLLVVFSICPYLATSTIARGEKKSLSPAQSTGPRPRGNADGAAPADTQLVFGLVNQFVGGNPGHHGAQLAADFLDFGLGVQAAVRRQRRCAGSVLQNKLLGVFASLDLLQAFAHGLTGFVSNDFGPLYVLTILGVVRDGVVHVGDAAFVNQVNNQLQFVQALEVGHFGRVAGVNQRI